MEFFPNYNTALLQDAGEWALEREAEGYDGVVISDHLFVGEKPYPHVWVTLARVACATTTLKFASSFCNNLFRSPVEFAQASLTLHQLAKGRFEAGLGAGWSEPEMRAMDLPYPEARDRAGRVIEAIKIVREIFQTGKCQFEGEYYNIDLPVIGPYDGTYPILVASAGGPRTRRELTPLIDRIEVFVGDMIRGGNLDFPTLAGVTDQQVEELVGQVRAIRPDIPIGYFTLMAAGESPEVQALEQALGDGFAGGLVGHPEKVATSLRKMNEWGINRMQLTELVPGSYTAMAPYLEDLQ